MIPALELADVSVKRRLKSLRLGVHVGEVLAVVGANGAGKSTLLGVMAGDIKPNTGSVRLFGQPLAKISLADRAKQRAVLLQESVSAFAYTVEELVGMAQMAGARPQELHYAASTLELTEHWQTPVDRLSGGERQRANIARVMAQIWSREQALLLLDEPTNHLDMRHEQALLKMIRLRARRGVATVLATHDLNWAAAIADRVAVLVAGELRACGKPKDVMTSSVLSEAFNTPVHVQFSNGVVSVAAMGEVTDEHIDLAATDEAA